MDNLRRALYNSFGQVLRGAGFTRRGAAWYRHAEATTQVIHLQRSDHARRFYLNVAVALRELLPDPNPPEHRCHVRTRLDQIAPDGALADAALDFESVPEAAIDARCRQAADLVGQWAVPWLDALRSREDLAAFLASPAAGKALVTRSVRESLGMRQPG